MSDSSDRLPPLNALRAFEAVARLGSFERAAAELAVGASAVGKRIAALEALGPGDEAAALPLDGVGARLVHGLRARHVLLDLLLPQRRHLEPGCSDLEPLAIAVDPTFLPSMLTLSSSASVWTTRVCHSSSLSFTGTRVALAASIFFSSAVS